MSKVTVSDSRALSNVKLSDKYTNTSGSIWINGTQAILRLLLDQSRLDRFNGIHTSGFVSGYRGSPLGSVDQNLSRESALLKEANIHFQPGVNEDLAATAIWGTQQTGLFQGARYDGVYGLWYGKAPGLDRSGDAIRHANMAGTAPKGGVLAVVGDDPACKSSTLPSSSIGVLQDLNVPVLVPSDVEDVMRLGLAGWALSRYSGCWVGLVAVTAVMDSAATVPVNHDHPRFIALDREIDPHIRLQDTPHEQEKRIVSKIEYASKFGSVNNLNQVVVDSEVPKLVLVGMGKAYTDMRQALRMLGFTTDAMLVNAGIRIIKMGMVWPLDATDLNRYLRGAQDVFVIEGKGNYLENTLKTTLYGRRGPIIEGKTDIFGKQLLPSLGELHSRNIAPALVRVLKRRNIPLPQTEFEFFLDRQNGPSLETEPSANESRKPLFCPGCPHSVSTQLPAGSRALAGIGCHYMAQWMNRETYTFTHMGGEGVNWIGQAPFTDENHIFVNLGDGTYFHSGLMAIRAAIAAKVNVTYKILFNDAVAMTGGQPVEGDLSVGDVVDQVLAEGASAVHVVTDEPSRYSSAKFDVSHRDRLIEIEEQLRDTPGCTVLIYDQTCSNELRRRRKRGQAPAATKRVVINDAVCEGCGDCTRVSLCSAIEPVSTDLGVKRRINQTMCNQDLSCMKGYCPAMIEVEGQLRVPEKVTIDPSSLKSPSKEIPDHANILVAGVGGTGIVTVSQVLGMAAHLEGKHASTLDMTGLAQKGGAVFAHVRIDAEPLLRTEIPSNSADVLIAADPVTSVSREALELVNEDSTATVVNSHLIPTAAFVLRSECDATTEELLDILSSRTNSLVQIDADRLSARVVGSSTTANMVLLGFAWQHGLIPLRKESIERALELNGVLVEDNVLAFRAGRKFALDPSFMEFSDRPDESMFPLEDQQFDELLERRMQFLSDYQDDRYADRLQRMAGRIRDAEERLGIKTCDLSTSVTNTYFMLLASKDEYEVARLLTHDRFNDYIDIRFQSVTQSNFAFAPTWWPGATKKKVRLNKRVVPLLRILAGLKFLRGSLVDPFKYSSERKFEKFLRDEFESVVSTICARLTKDNMKSANALVSCFANVRGFGHVKVASWETVREQVKELQKEFDLETTYSVENGGRIVA